MAAPQEVMANFERRWDLECGDVASLRVQPGEDVPDRAVFARGVHTLQDDQQGLGFSSVEALLEVGESLAVLLQRGILLPRNPQTGRCCPFSGRTA